MPPSARMKARSTRSTQQCVSTTTCGHAVVHRSCELEVNLEGQDRLLSKSSLLETGIRKPLLALHEGHESQPRLPQRLDESIFHEQGSRLSPPSVYYSGVDEKGRLDFALMLRDITRKSWYRSQCDTQSASQRAITSFRNGRRNVSATSADSPMPKKPSKCWIR